MFLPVSRVQYQAQCNTFVPDKLVIQYGTDKKSIVYPHSVVVAIQYVELDHECALYIDEIALLIMRDPTYLVVSDLVSG
jgi:hypothetical protein